MSREQTARQYPSRAVPAKLQNCTEFGTYEPTMGSRSKKFVCNGGFTGGHYYRPCPVANECMEMTLKKKEMTPIEIARFAATTQSDPVKTVSTSTSTNPVTGRPGIMRVASGFSTPGWVTPNFGDLPTAMGGLSPNQQRAQATPGQPAAAQQPPKTPQEQAQAAQQRAAQAAAYAQAMASQWPQVVHPRKNAGPGMRTPFVASGFNGESSPIWLPQEGEEIGERLWLNIVQGVLSTTAYHVWAYLRNVDLFD